MSNITLKRCGGLLPHVAALLGALSSVAVPAANRVFYIEHAWAPPTPPGSAVAVVYLRIVNNGGVADRLMTIDTPIAERVAVHQSHIVAGVMQMREVDSVVCPAGSVLASEPGGMHFMLMGVKQALTPGLQFPLSLHFEKAGTIGVSVAVNAAE